MGFLEGQCSDDTELYTLLCNLVGVEYRSQSDEDDDLTE